MKVNIRCLCDKWSQRTSQSFQTAAHVVSTQSGESTLCLLPHMRSYRHPSMPSISVMGRGEKTCHPSHQLSKARFALLDPWTRMAVSSSAFEILANLDVMISWIFFCWEENLISFYNIIYRHNIRNSIHLYLISDKYYSGFCVVSFMQEVRKQYAQLSLVHWSAADQREGLYFISFLQEPRDHRYARSRGLWQGWTGEHWCFISIQTVYHNFSGCCFMPSAHVSMLIIMVQVYLNICVCFLQGKSEKWECDLCTEVY